jgi:hypothetical protein
MSTSGTGLTRKATSFAASGCLCHPHHNMRAAVHGRLMRHARRQERLICAALPEGPRQTGVAP